MNSFFSNASTGNQLEIAAPLSSWDTDSFTLEYKVGLTAETQEEVDMRTSETVLITMMKDCDFTMPTISSDSTYGDTRTYVRTYSPVTLTFTGSQATCYDVRTVTTISGSSIPGFFTFTPDSSSDDTLVFSTNSPTYEGTYDLKYVLTSTEAPEFY